MNNPLLAMKKAAYLLLLTDGPNRCVSCDHIAVDGQWLRCSRGGFIVSKGGLCMHFQYPASQSVVTSAPARADGRVQIGPTDI